MYMILIVFSLALSQIGGDGYNTTRIYEHPSFSPTMFYLSPTNHPPLIQSQCNDTLNDSNEIKIHYPLFPNLTYNLNASIDTSIDSNTVYINSPLLCPTTANNDSCYYWCLGDAICLKSMIFCNSKYGCNIECFGDYACASMTVTSSPLIPVSMITIVCDQFFACNDMRIDAVSFKEIHIHCIGKNSCNSLNIMIHSNNTISSVSCYNMHSCDGIYYFARFIDAQSTLFMYRYSKDVTAHNINNIQCMDDTQYIQYTENMTLEEIEQQITDQKLPCGGTHEICGNYSCDVKYSIHPIMAAKYVQNMVHSECYLVPISTVTNRTCDECYNSYGETEDMIIGSKIYNNNAMIWCSLIVIFISLIISFISYAYNLHPKSLVDNARIYASIIVALQMINIWSDINLCVEIFSKSSFNENILILLSGVGVLTFILLPYLINILLAKHIQLIIRSNIACKQYFEIDITEIQLRNDGNIPKYICIHNTHHILFAILILLCGSVWCSLLLLSSQIFGIHLLNNGLTTYDLMQLLTRRKSVYFITSHTLLHNVPQIIFQCLYCIAIKQVSCSASLAFVTSLITSILFILFYIMEKQKMSWYYSVQYYLQISTKSKRDLTANDEYMLEYQHLILAKKGKKAKLLRRIQNIFGTKHHHNIEIGYTSLTKHGCLTHFVSRLHTDDISTTYLKPDELMHLNNSNTSHTFLTEVNETDPNQTIANQYIKHVYVQHMEHLTECFRSHYGIDTQIHIIYHDSYPHDLVTVKPPKSSFIELFNFPQLPTDTQTYTKIAAITQCTKERTPSANNEKKTRLRRTQSNPIQADKSLFTVDGAKKKKHMPHVRLMDSDDDDAHSHHDIETYNAESLLTIERETEDEFTRRGSDTMEESIDYAGELSYLTVETQGFTKSPHTSMTRNKSHTVIGYQSHANDDVLSIGRSRAMTTKKPNLRILYRFDGWPEPQIINMYKFNQIQNGLNLRNVLQYIEQHLADEYNDVLEYEQIRFATTPTYILGRRGWKRATHNSFIPFLIGEDGVNEVDIWLRTKGFITKGVGKQLKFRIFSHH